MLCYWFSQVLEDFPSGVFMFSVATPVRMCPFIFSLPLPTFSLEALVRISAILDPTRGGCFEIWYVAFPSKIISAIISTS
jgi:hypothetical protein